MKLGGLFKRMSPGCVSAGRRYRWPSAEAAYEHFAAKSAFARWAPGVLQDYIACGMVPAAEGGVTLAFRREVETHIYNTLPHHMGRVLNRHPPRCPVAFIGGTRSAEIRQAGLAATRALAHDRLPWAAGRARHGTMRAPRNHAARSAPACPRRRLAPDRPRCPMLLPFHPVAPGRRP